MIKEREKLYICNTSLWISDSSAVIVFAVCFLPSNWNGNWILLVSSSILARTPQTNICDFFFLLFWLGNENCPFPKGIQAAAGQLKLERKHHKSSHVVSCVLVAVTTQKKTTWDIHTTNKENLSHGPCWPSLHLKMLKFNIWKLSHWLLFKTQRVHL